MWDLSPVVRTPANISFLVMCIRYIFQVILRVQLLPLLRSRKIFHHHIRWDLYTSSLS
jgi:hypothetical protein